MMLDIRRSFLVPVALCLAPATWASACGSDAEAPAPDGGGSGGSGAGGKGSGGSAAGGGPAATGGAAAVDCDMAPCEGRVIQAGVALPTCCIDAQTCGLGAPGLCLPVSSFDDLGREGGPLPPAETIVLDPTCPDQVLGQGGFVLTLKGCCDAAGFCGTAIGEGSPFAQCLTPEDARAAGQPDAGPSIRCGTVDTPDASSGSGGAGHVVPEAGTRGDAG
jgi:hypothetical protein